MTLDHRKPSTVSVRAHDVPNEILSLIFSHLHKEDLKSIRLVCKLWTWLPVRLLFDRVYISPHSVNIKVFKSIAAHPVISRCIKELVYDVSHFNADFTRSYYFGALSCQLHTWCSHLPGRGFRFETVDEQLNEVLEFAIYRLFKTQGHDNTNREELSNYHFVDRGHRAYLDSARQQQEYHESGELLAVLCLGLKKLPALDAVSFSGLWTQYLTDRKFDPATLRPIHLSGSPLARTWNPLFLEPSVIMCRQDPAHNHFSTVIRGLSLSQTKISGFESSEWLKLYQPTFNTKALMSPSLLHHTVNALSQVQRFSLVQITSEHKIDTQPIDALPVILRSMTELKYLSLNLCKCSDADNTLFTLAEIFGSHRVWPHLASLYLASFAADEANLIAFLVSLSALRLLGLRDVELTDGNWASAFAQFRRSLRLRELTLEGPLKPSGGIEVWALPEWPEDRSQRDKERFSLYGEKNIFKMDT